MTFITIIVHIHKKGNPRENYWGRNPFGTENLHLVPLNEKEVVTLLGKSFSPVVLWGLITTNITNIQSDLMTLPLQMRKSL